MNLPNDWQWWGNQGGRHLRVELEKNNAVAFTASDEQGHIVTVTLANFRVRQLREWLARSTEPEIRSEG